MPRAAATSVSDRMRQSSPSPSTGSTRRPGGEPTLFLGQASATQTRSGCSSSGTTSIERSGASTAPRRGRRGSPEPRQAGRNDDRRPRCGVRVVIGTASRSRRRRWRRVGDTGCTALGGKPVRLRERRRPASSRTAGWAERQPRTRATTSRVSARLRQGRRLAQRPACGSLEADVDGAGRPGRRSIDSSSRRSARVTASRDGRSSRAGRTRSSCRVPNVPSTSR